MRPGPGGAADQKRNSPTRNATTTAANTSPMSWRVVLAALLGLVALVLLVVNVRELRR